ncbi:3-isopropylmalate dehydratase large subunit [Ramlibacter albus]|uniref:3-isopropylmalate dehydratase n=1 Tax=Ramlibacter albus TaxID=2079448 RepID=A0A923MBE6_9BURK|nr:3-isopropylmalate dehydratase large subunit [Ramlibacter albus]MBC5767298.1 3-isopropylmalate dehydratase large subunit [Ramlibacter albus]
MGATYFDKCWDEHVVTDFGDGTCLLQVDRLLLHDVTGSVVMREMSAAGHAPECPAQVFGVIDHLLVTKPQPEPRKGWTPAAVQMIDEARWRARELGIQLVDVDDPRQGITHVIAPELGIALPGLTVACGDSHTCTLGGIGAIGWGIGTSEGAHVLATQTIVEAKPKRMRVRFEGELPAGVSAKDMILHLIGRIGAGGGAGYAIEFAGSAVRALDVEARLTLCNMAVECQAKYGFIAPDDKVFDYLRGRAYAPQGEAWDRAVAHWRSLATDDDAVFDTEIEIDVAQLEPQVTWGTSPQHVAPVSSKIPAPEDAFAERALAYQQLQPGAELAQVRIDVAYIGTCTNARLSDLRLAASYLRGRKVAPHVTAICVPGSAAVKRDAEAEGLHEVFLAAGFEWHEPGCGMCGSGRGRLEDVRCISTSNRNFENRQGKRTRTHLASPLTVAASAVAGHIADPRTA